ncbi:AraC-like DNA-binding protein/polyhydroxyalkanoate synthesis regulator phasin [Chryseobacterium defluvii]|uniref:AraC-like DNA-binding protein/polyhydroxyalkanoate synthesis regulator phasin n=1 Tax=Chryseobacterium defluvii TaxID=160396 RepID=A0A840K6E2_9FLAO|nr:AraC family transcriptional regulator [Chryseobacterium defluvii]MBB4805101.1 AraC-like DNA-binding protein/polyhydroxyalkanoate synthesis regulator phasin [Chryseobacterium defluvii]
MKKIVTSFKYVFLFVMMISGCTALAQNHKGLSDEKTEEMRKKAEVLLYEKPDQALQLADKVYQLTKNENNLTFAHTSALLAEIYSIKGDQKKSIQYAETAKKTYEDLDKINYSVDMLNIISREYSVLGLFNQAIQSNDMALSAMKSRVMEESNDDNIRILALTYDTRSYIYDQKMEVSDSLVKYNELSYQNAMRLKQTPDNMLYQQMSANNLVNTYLKKKERSEKETKRVFEILAKARGDEKKFPNKKSEAYLAFNFGNYYFTQENDQSALKEYLNALSLAQHVEDIYLQRDVHEMLALTYASMKNPDKELYHQKKYNELSKKIHLSEKQNTNTEVTKIQSKNEESFFKTKRNLIIAAIIIGILLFISVWIGIRNYKKSKREYANYKKIIEKLQKKESILTPVTNAVVEKTIFSVPTDKEKEILHKLDQFEGSEAFVNKNISLSSLAESFNTNTAYLSTVINANKNKNFNNYINELRISYIVNKLKNDPQYLKYKISHLAEESGFSSHNTFTTAFSNCIGVSPSNFIKFLTKETKISAGG